MSFNSPADGSTQLLVSAKGVNVKGIKMDETEYTTAIAIALNSYVCSKVRISLPAPYTPHSRRQSYKDLNKALCFDIVQRLTDASLLILEVKVTHDGRKLHSFDAQQRRGDAALRAIGIPLEYCYNTANDYVEINNELYTLTETLTAHPSHVSDDRGMIIDTSSHKSLKKAVDALLVDQTGNGGMVGALFNKKLIKSMRELNIKILFFAYRAGKLDLLSEEDLFSLYDSYSSHVALADGVDLETATQSELEAGFISDAQKLLDLVEDWRQEKSLKNESRGNSSFGLDL